MRICSSSVLSRVGFSEVNYVVLNKNLFFNAVTQKLPSFLPWASTEQLVPKYLTAISASKRLRRMDRPECRVFIMTSRQLCHTVYSQGKLTGPEYSKCKIIHEYEDQEEVIIKDCVGGCMPYSLPCLKFLCNVCKDPPLSLGRQSRNSCTSLFQIKNQLP